MNWLKNIFKRKPLIVTKTVQVPMPSGQKWLLIDQKTTSAFLRSEQGRKMVEALRHKLFAEHLDACQTAGNAEQHNASMKGANNALSFILYLATEDSISGNDSPAKESNTDQDPHYLGSERRA